MEFFDFVRHERFEGRRPRSHFQQKVRPSLGREIFRVATRKIFVTKSLRAHKTKQISTARDFFVLVRAGAMPNQQARPRGRVMKFCE
ncbi:MAG: hypothetical protein A2928_00195 [Candidatus Taylorbacteria bacterium RIFCSPLOWO2_01_FULL_45_15b]|uniref:Uncharacterized protein n=1 Tax=Candidatus Taylorbacteria bacterium RIFCSPLOWO2_01_FULL_45_15b TaxID=1802319 RepID=A0A1G2N9T1_9BACT|nr:MAG: hypothetical protein A2928_00195 [Candidatus Taylorbacteria bacterium RIFCSPLOWO2_01_FULL_45_15b]